MTRATAPRLVPLATAQKVLGGAHPILLGIGEAVGGLYDLRAIHAALDRKAGLDVTIGEQGAANDIFETDELQELAKRITADASRRA